MALELRYPRFERSGDCLEERSGDEGTVDLGFCIRGEVGAERHAESLFCFNASQSEPMLNPNSSAKEGFFGSGGSDGTKEVLLPRSFSSFNASDSRSNDRAASADLGVAGREEKETEEVEGFGLLKRVVEVVFRGP